MIYSAEELAAKYGCNTNKNTIFVDIDTPDNTAITLLGLLYDTHAEKYTQHNTTDTYLLDSWDVPVFILSGGTAVEIENGTVYLSNDTGNIIGKYTTPEEFKANCQELWAELIQKYNFYLISVEVRLK